MKHTIKKRTRRARRVRSTIIGTANKPRLSVFRSNKYTYLQAIDDEHRVTLVSSSTSSLKDRKGTKTEIAGLIGEKAGELLLKKKIKTGIFDRGPYKYNGRVKAVAEGLRKAGIQV